ncbi:MAG: heme o synthase [bacterium]
MSDILELNEAAVQVAAGWRVRAYLELTKARIIGLVLVVVTVGFFLSLRTQADWTAITLLMHTLLGTALVAGGANALNQYLEADYDGRMFRTQERPLPSGRLSRAEALAFGVGIAGAGLLYLALRVNLLCALLTGLTLTSYIFLYTPMKRRTAMCVYIGAVPGALPPVIGWAAGGGSLSMEAWVLFAIVFFWQLPHFAAIAWQYRDDYARAGYPMLSVIDRDGLRTNLHVITHSVGLLTMSVLPVLAGRQGAVYGIGAVVLGTAFLACGVLFVVRKTPAAARFHVLASVTYLPLLFALMMIDRSPLR